MKEKYDPYNHTYEVGDLIIYKGAFLDDLDEIGIIINVVPLKHDSMDLIYEIDVPSGRDVVTQFDAQFILVPFWAYEESSRKKQTVLDSLREHVIIDKEDEP